MSEEDAKEFYDSYSAQIKERGDNAEKYLKDLKQTYYHLSKGRKVLDIFEVFKNCEKFENGEPRLGIARADLKTIYLHKQRLGAARFAEERTGWRTKAADVSLPSSTFAEWPLEADDKKPEWRTTPDIDRKVVQTNVPLVPAHILPNGSLDNYYILFEVHEWTEIPTPPVAADPYLLRRINANAFAVLAEWDVSEVEQAVMRGTNG